MHSTKWSCSIRFWNHSGGHSLSSMQFTFGWCNTNCAWSCIFVGEYITTNCCKLFNKSMFTVRIKQLYLLELLHNWRIQLLCKSLDCSNCIGQPKQNLLCGQEILNGYKQHAIHTNTVLWKIWRKKCHVFVWCDSDIWSYLHTFFYPISVFHSTVIVVTVVWWFFLSFSNESCEIIDIPSHCMIQIMIEIANNTGSVFKWQ